MHNAQLNHAEKHNIILLGKPFPKTLNANGNVICADLKFLHLM